jgi:uncharacterized peroxidase-related enzyme
VRHHQVSLARLTRRRSPELAQQIASDYTQAPLSQRERSILDYAAKLTRTPGKMEEDDLCAMREVGLSDEAILDAAMITAYFAYVNRIADGLGVAIESDDDDAIGW